MNPKINQKIDTDLIDVVRLKPELANPASRADSASASVALLAPRFAAYSLKLVRNPLLLWKRPIKIGKTKAPVTNNIKPIAWILKNRRVPPRMKSPAAIKSITVPVMKSPHPVENQSPKESQPLLPVNPAIIRPQALTP